MNTFRNWLSTQGRLNRKVYFYRCITLLLLALAMSMLNDSSILTVFIAVLFVLFIIQTIKRLHDLNHSGWWTLMMLVPVLNLFSGLWVVLKRGVKEDNKYSNNI